MADKRVYFIAPIISTIPAFVAFSVIPFGGEVTIFGEPTVLQLVDLPVGVLVVLACSSIGVYGIVLGGWASGSPYPLLAALRSAAQVISYEIALGLSIVGVILYAGSLSTADIVASQASGWYVMLLLPSFVVFVISMVGETNRAPFDLPEAESELVGGFHTEYSSLKFALFFLAEYVNMVTVSAMATTLFLGGGMAVAAVVPQHQRLVAVRGLPDQDVHLPVRVHLAARHAAAAAVRPVHAAGLEGAGPGQPAVDPGDLRDPHVAADAAAGGVALLIALGIGWRSCCSSRSWCRTGKSQEGPADRAGVGLPGAAAGPDRAHHAPAKCAPAGWAANAARAAHPGARRRRRAE